MSVHGEQTEPFLHGVNAIESSRHVGSLVVRRLQALPISLVALTMLAAGCRHDGREMRPALPSQGGSVSTTAAATIPETEDDDFFDSVASNPDLPGGPIEPSTTGTAGTGPSTVAPLVPALVVTAPWRDGGPIDARYTCKGDNVSPALSWSDSPVGTQEIAITLIDQNFDFDHWTMAGIAPDITALAENSPPEGAVAALNGSGALGYTGPCPPAGVAHTYRITVHFLDRALLLSSGGAADDMRNAIDDATIATAQVTGSFTGS
jgi:Raf kinase inhibitor-like YbhB/YbcL family protein